MGFSKEVSNFFETAKRRKFAVKCDWKGKTSQNVRNLVSLNKTYVFFGKKMCFFWKIAEGSKFAVECDWISKISQRVQNLGFVENKSDALSEKNFLSKIAAISKFALECDWISKNLQNVRKFCVTKMGFLLTKNFIEKKR